MNGDQYVPSGVFQGDDKPMPDRGTSTGVTDSYGVDLSQSGTNSQGKITRATRSDAMFDNEPDAEGQKDGDE